MTVVLVILASILVHNLWATWRVAVSGLSVHRKTLAILGTWLIPLAGSYMALDELKQQRLAKLPRSPLPLPRVPREAPVSRVESAGLEPFDVRDHLEEGHWLPILDFEALDAWAAKAATPAAAQEARERGRRAWLLHLGHWMGEHVQLVEAHGCRVLGGFSAGAARATCRYMADTHRRITELLGGLARIPEDGSTLILLDDEDDYYKYVANFYPEEGEFAFSSGMFISGGFPHFVAVRGDEAQLELVIAHEMTHLALSHLSLPLWLDEGLAVNTERRLAFSPQSADSALELLAAHHAFWNAETIQEFWTGTSFHRSDEGNRLSYDLARAMVDLLGRDWPAFTRFANAARREDGGAGAARDELGMDLGDLAAAAINATQAAPWTPKTGWRHVSTKARA